MTQDTSVLAHSAGAKAKVFISYSRKDMAFADRIEAALKARAFEPQIDRAEIHAFEDWWERIEALIVKTDTIVFVLSPDAVASDVCQREVAFATSLNKRFAPIVCRPVNDKSIPRSLARLNFVFFTDEARFEESADKLAEALSIDINWVRKHTDFGEQARRWSQAGRPGPRALLLRSPVLEDAEQWIATRPAAGPSPTEATRAFISESRKAATRRRNILTSSLGTGLLVALALAGLAFWQRAVAIEQQRLAVQQRDAAQVAQSRFLTDRANREVQTGDAATSVLLALAALPDERESVRRPYVPAAELALFNGSQKGGETALLKGHDDAVDGAAFSPDGMRVVTASADTTARIWDAATAAQIAVLKHDDWVLSAAFSPDGRRVVTGSSQAKARIWDAATGAQIIALAAHYSAVTSAAFSPDGRRVVTASEDKTARIWDAATGALIVMLEGHDDEVNSAAFSPDGSRVVTASQDHTARIWDAAIGAQVAVLKGDDSSVRSAAFSPDGKRVVTASEDKTARIWDVATAAQIATLKGHDERVLAAVFSPDGRRVVTASEDRTVRIWDVAAEAQIVVLKGHDARIRNVAFSPDGRCIVTTASISASDKTARIWDAATGAQIAVLTHDDWVQGAAFTADGQRVVTMSRDKTARIWDASTGAQIATVKGRDGLVERAAFSPDGKRAVAMSSDRTAVWDIVTGAEIVLKGHNSQVNGAAFSPDGRRVVTASDDTTARIWDAATGAQIAMLEGHSGQVTGAVFSPDGRRVVTASNDSTARIWDAVTAAQIAVLKGHDAVLQSAAFGPDGRRVMTASNDSTARMWDATTGAQIAVLMTHDQQVSTAALSPDGRRVLIMFWDKGSPQMRIWHVFPTTQDLVDDTKKVVPRCLTRQQRDDAFLDATPPAWCIEMEKWPYQTQDWKHWLTYTRANDSPPLPDAPEWQAWVAVRKAK
jgi:WD40 repeat protein